MGLYLIAAAAFVAAVAYVLLFVGRREKNLPPGPPTLPIIGNLHQMPTKGAHFQFTEWAKTYGGIYSLKLGSGTMVVLTSPRLIKQLIDKKSSIYSNRPTSFVADLITSSHHTLVMNYSPLWKLFRKLIHQSFSEGVVEKKHTEVVNAEACQMVYDMMVKPEEHMLHPKRFSNSVIMSLLFGYRTPTVDTPHMSKLYHLMESWSKVMEPGNTPPVDIFPFLHWVPERLFGNWRSRASFVRDEMNALYSAQVERVRARRASGERKESFMDAVLEQNEKLTLSPHELAFLGGVMMEGGSDTSSATIISFLQAMTRWPAYQLTAQAQIDVVVPEDRSPQWAQDYDALPYVAQIVKESMRWRPVVPLAFPHAAAQDDEIDGFRIPKGSAVILNGWGMQHDAARFAHPEIFDPAHYAGFTRPASALALEADPAKRDHYGYGSGRRLCPGIHLGERNLWVGIAKLLWAFEICAVEGEMPDTDAVTGYCEGFLVCAKDFKCRIRVRSEERRKTIVREFEEAKKVFARFE